MYTITKSIDIDFAHHVRGHLGACINIHGHTWKFEVTLGAEQLDDMGFVVDFGDLKRQVLAPCHQLLDHSFALPKLSLTEDMRRHLAEVGWMLVGTRKDKDGSFLDMANRVASGDLGYTRIDAELGGAGNEILGGIKIAAFPFNPTSERLAKWLWDVAAQFCQSRSDFVDAPADPKMLGGPRVQKRRVWVLEAAIYETLHPVQAVARYHP